MNAKHLIAALALVCAGQAQAEDVEGDLANQLPVQQAREACTDAAIARGLRVKRPGMIKSAGNDALDVRLELEGGADVRCIYHKPDARTEFPGLAGPGDTSRSLAVRACEKAADRLDLRLGRVDRQETKPGRIIDVHFRRPLFGQPQLCHYDIVRGTARFEGHRDASASR